MRSLEEEEEVKIGVVDPGPMVRFGDVVMRAETPGVVFQRVAEGETLREIARSWGVPVGRFTQWFCEEHGGLYDAALKVRADELAHEALVVARTPQRGVTTKTKGDGTVEVTEEDMLGHRKLYTETMLKLAGKWDRDRYGEKTDIRHSGLVPTLVIEIGGGGVEERVVGEAEEVTPLPEKPPSTHELI